MQPKGIWCKIRQSSICETKTGQEYKTVEPVEAQFSCFAQIIQGITNLPHIVAHLSESVKTGSNAYKVASCRKDQGCTPAAPTFLALYCHAIVLTHWFKSDTEKGMFFFWAEIKVKSKVPSWFRSNEESLRKKREAKEKEQLHWQPCFSQAIFPLRSSPHSNSSIILVVNFLRLVFYNIWSQQKYVPAFAIWPIHLNNIVTNKDSKKSFVIWTTQWMPQELIWVISLSRKVHLPHCEKYWCVMWDAGGGANIGFPSQYQPAHLALTRTRNWPKSLSIFTNHVTKRKPWGSKI